MNPNIDLTNNSQGESITVSGFNISKNASNAYLRKPTSHSTPNEPVHDKSNTHGTRPGVSTSPPTHTPTQNFFIPWTPKLGPEERHRLWNESRFDSNGNEISKDEGREFNRKNIVSSLKLAPYVFAQLFRIQWEACGFRILLTYLSTTIHGILPAWRAVAMANLMDAVQEALSSRQSSDVKRIVWLAAIDIVAANTETLLNLLFRNNEELVSSLITEKFQRMYLESTLLMDIPTINDPQIRPVLFEAGVFAGIEHQFTYRGRSSDHFSSLLSVFTSLLHVLSQATILLKVLTSASNPLSWANLLFAFITFLPAFITLIERFVIVTPVYLGDFGMKTRQITQLGQMGPYKQEILLFGLADWVLQKWENVTFDSRQRRTEYRQNERISYTGVNIIRDSLHSMQYAFIAIGAFPATISLGSMRLCQNSASSLVSTLMMVQDRVRLFMDMVFQFEAFSQVMQMKDVKTSEKGVLRRYETTVVDGQKRGMRIEARNLSFTYPGQTEPALKNVNLTIEPGETLAIVGFNGGGKTTLVKVLMGLYNYSGSLTINDHEASTYDRPSLHAKTTVCFQDFSRYDDTVKENVGTGNFRRMDDLELLGTALKRGGADTVVDQLDDGIDQLLHQWGTPLDAEPGAGPNKKSGKTDKVKPPKTMGKGRGRFMRMHALARDVGTNLSGGQWQRLALARAFMRSDEADLVVFDEPSSSLDAVAEHELFERIHGLSKSETGQKIKTTIYVSHRFNTTRKADKIAVVENGTVTEVGSHDKLMALGGRYAEFFNLQAQAFL